MVTTKWSPDTNLNTNADALLKAEDNTECTPICNNNTSSHEIDICIVLQKPSLLVEGGFVILAGGGGKQEREENDMIVQLSKSFLSSRNRYNLEGMNICFTIFYCV